MTASANAMTIPEAAKALGISRGLAYEQAQRGELPGVRRIGTRWLVSRVELEKWLGNDQAKMVHQTQDIGGSINIASRFYTLSEAAKRLQVERHTVSRWIRAGRLDAQKVGATVLIEKRDVEMNSNLPYPPNTTEDPIRNALQCGRSGCSCSGTRSNIHCPAHIDDTPSLRVKEASGMENNIGAAALSVEGACRYIAVSRPTLYRLMERGDIPSFHIVRRRLILRQHLDAYLQGRLEAEAGR